MELDTVWGIRWTHDKAYHGLQPLQEWKGQFRHIIPTTTSILHYEEEGPHMPMNAVPATPYRCY